MPTPAHGIHVRGGRKGRGGEGGQCMAGRQENGSDPVQAQPTAPCRAPSVIVKASKGTAAAGERAASSARRPRSNAAALARRPPEPATACHHHCSAMTPARECHESMHPCRPPPCRRACCMGTSSGEGCCGPQRRTHHRRIAPELCKLLGRVDFAAVGQGQLSHLADRQCTGSAGVCAKEG